MTPLIILWFALVALALVDDIRAGNKVQRRQRRIRQKHKERARAAREWLAAKGLT